MQRSAIQKKETEWMKQKMCKAGFGVVWQKCQQIGVSYSGLLSFTSSELDSPLASDEFGKRSKKFCTMGAFGCQQCILGVRNIWNMKNGPTAQRPRIFLASPLHISLPRCWRAMLTILKVHFFESFRRFNMDKSQRIKFCFTYFGL